MSKWEELEKAARAATPGPWNIVRSRSRTSIMEIGPLCADEYAGLAWIDCQHKDAAFISAANPSAILELLAERDALKAELDRIRAMEPYKLPIPPAQAEMTDVLFAEGWNQCCDTFFGGRPPQELQVLTITECLSREPVAAQHRFRHPQKTEPDWSAWQPCDVRNRPPYEIDSQGYEVEYRNLYTMEKKP